MIEIIRSFSQEKGKDMDMFWISSVSKLGNIYIYIFFFFLAPVPSNQETKQQS